jgi:hypothetical protein
MIECREILVEQHIYYICYYYYIALFFIITFISEQVNRSVNEWHASLAERQATWHSLQSSLAGFTQWLSETEDRLRVSQDEPLTQAKLTQKELEKQVTLKHRYGH